MEVLHIFSWVDQEIDPWFKNPKHNQNQLQWSIFYASIPEKSVIYW